jgi:superfamily II DNA or RNA helicase
MEKRELDKEFKDKDNPLKIVFVCAMWLTGFDVKCLSCLYLDKPLKAHTLMQTIARANRAAEGKSNGLIVDYIGIVKALRKALADYTANTGGGTDPTVDKGELIARIMEVIVAADTFLNGYNFSLKTLVEDLLKREFAKAKKKNLMFMDLDDLIQQRLDSMLKENPRRVDYYERYQQIIEEYNNEQDRATIEKTFMELIDLANSMSQEEQRYVREGFSSDEELSLYDMLFSENLSKKISKRLRKWQSIC